ncbi:porin [Chitinimonas sp. BJYL2]|uniref:porin n=1 Tax=Chitinimonas sp. BJYL2 TaxID=2976696 RepID=UPI0022B4362F|nr:porin [Chitinimonas sp. BJYL2]
MQTLKPLALALATALSAAAWADDTAFSFSGFGTVSAVSTNTDNAEFRAVSSQPNGAKKNASYTVDTKLGVQGVAKFNDQWSATLQLLSTKNEKNNFTPGVEWAFVKYQATPNVAVRVGRIGTPTFLISDYRNVGYANIWARPPVDVYSQVANGRFDGIDMLYKHNVGDGTVTLQPYTGASKTKLPGDFNIDFKKMMGINAVYEIDSWLFRAGYIRTDLTGHSPGMDTILIPGMSAVANSTVLPAAISGPWKAALNDLIIKDKLASFTGIGATYDDGQLVFQGEYTQRRTESFVDDTDGWYTTLGYRFGDFTPYVSYASVETKVNHITDNLPTPTVQLAGLKAAVIDTKAGADQSTTTLGLRWNAMKNVAIKFQFDRVQTEKGKDNFFTKQKIDSTDPFKLRSAFAGESVNVYTIAADFVF